MQHSHLQIGCVCVCVCVCVMNCVSDVFSEEYVLSTEVIFVKASFLDEVLADVLPGARMVLCMSMRWFVCGCVHAFTHLRVRVCLSGTEREKE